MAHATAKLTVKIGCDDYFVETDFRYNPGEPMVRYYADGSGYPGSPAEVDCIDRVKIIECERCISGNEADCYAGNWDYFTRDDLFGNGEDVASIEREVIAELSGGTYDDELLEQTGCDDYDE